MRYDPVVVPETADPEGIVAQIELHGEVVATGEACGMPFIQVMRVRGGRIVSMRDYFAGEILEAAFDAGQTRD